MGFFFFGGGGGVVLPRRKWGLTILKNLRYAHLLSYVLKSLSLMLLCLSFLIPFYILPFFFRSLPHEIYIILSVHLSVCLTLLVSPLTHVPVSISIPPPPPPTPVSSPSFPLSPSLFLVSALYSNSKWRHLSRNPLDADRDYVHRNQTMTPSLHWTT